MTRLRARMDDLDAAMALVQAFCAAHAVAADDALRLQLVVEELFTNTVVHGHGGDSDSPVKIELAVEANGLRLVYTDRAPAFNPTAVAHGSATPNQVGGAGLGLIAALVREMAYTRTEGANCLSLLVARQPPNPP